MKRELWPECVVQAARPEESPIPKQRGFRNFDGGPSALRVLVRRVNGDLVEIERSPRFARQVQELDEEGIRGGDIVRLLLGDQWRAPPLGMNVTGRMPDGRLVDFTVASW